MAFDVSEISETNESVVVNEKLWLSADRQKVVKDGDPEAAFLLATPGKRMPRVTAVELGLVKERKKAEDKAQKKTESK